MAKDETRQLSPKTLAEDREVYKALKAIADYAPSNPALSKDALDDSFEAMDAAQTKEIEAKGVWMGTRDDKVAAEWAFHNKILGGKVQVEAQYGPSSNQLQSLKLKKKTEFGSGGGGGKQDGEGSSSKSGQ